MMSAAFLCFIMMTCVVAHVHWVWPVYVGLDGHCYVIWWAYVMGIYMVLGCLVDGFDLLLFTKPAFYPVAVKVLDFDPFWFRATLVVLLESRC